MSDNKQEQPIDADELYEWGAVDSAANQQHYVNYLDNVSALESIRLYKQQSFELLRLKEGDNVLDVGCGLGDDIRTLAQTVGASGRAVGIDNSEAMVAQARSRTTAAALPVEFHVMEGDKLGFEDNFFDAARSDRVFQHLEDPKQVFAEILRVTRPGGRISITDPDWGTLAVDSSNRHLTREITNYLADERTRNGWMGRQLLRFFREHGLIEISVIPSSVILTDFKTASAVMRLEEAVRGAEMAEIISTNDAAYWLEELQEADARGQFFAAMTGFLIAGTKPA